MKEQLPPISIHLASVRAKDRERDALQADVDAFLAKRGNKVQRLPTQLGVRPEPTYRQLNDAMAASSLAAANKRRRRPAAEQ
ncbi:hypothetical protein [Pseudoxanthomonas jiangsuensis]|uniref:hypothetical protein n=1 Tax=Pseudoxanthomonas jiangsuensis TaxID=619688 RepID=UPI0013917091|nr:hypothetical protein [Pseudoxanthomonas jiangsuensis]